MFRLLACLLLLTGAALAHDLYLVVEGTAANGRVCARIGENFPGSENPIRLERIKEFMLFHERHGVELKPAVDSENKQTCAVLEDADAKTGEVVLVAHPSFIHLEAKEFNSYISAEGFTRVIAMRKQAGQSDSPGREKYSRYAKVILPGDSEATRGRGLELEIIPMKDPAKLKAGDYLPVQVAFRGRPLAGVRIAAAYAGAPLKGHHFPAYAVTNKYGEARLKLDRPGLWYLRLIHMLPRREAEPTAVSDILPGGPIRNSSAPEYDWRSFFATMTFTVPDEK